MPRRRRSPIHRCTLPRLGRGPDGLVLALPSEDGAPLRWTGGRMAAGVAGADAYLGRPAMAAALAARIDASEALHADRPGRRERIRPDGTPERGYNPTFDPGPAVERDDAGLWERSVLVFTAHDRPEALRGHLSLWRGAECFGDELEYRMGIEFAYVLPQHRGWGYGRAMAEAAVLLAEADLAAVAACPHRRGPLRVVLQAECVTLGGDATVARILRGLHALAEARAPALARSAVAPLPWISVDAEVSWRRRP